MRHPRSIPLALALVAGCYEAPAPKIIEPPPPPPVEAKIPQIEFSADKASVLAGGQVTLTYRVTDAKTVKVDVAGGVNVIPTSSTLDGSAFSPPISVNTTFVLTATNDDKVATRNVSVTITTVVEMPKLHAVIDTFAGMPASIEAGRMAALTWQTTNATEGKIKAGDMVVLTIASSDLARGSFAVSPVETTVYEVLIKGTDGQEVTLTRAISVTQPGATELSARQIFDRNVAPMFTAKCNNGFCHNVQNQASALVLTLGRAHASLVGVKSKHTACASFDRVVPGSPTTSFLIFKLQGNGSCFAGVRMPKGTGALSAADLQMVRDWISEGAKDN